MHDWVWNGQKGKTENLTTTYISSVSINCCQCHPPKCPRGMGQVSGSICSLQRNETINWRHSFMCCTIAYIYILILFCNILYIWNLSEISFLSSILFYCFLLLSHFHLSFGFMWKQEWNTALWYIYIYIHNGNWNLFFSSVIIDWHKHFFILYFFYFYFCDMYVDHNYMKSIVSKTKYISYDLIIWKRVIIYQLIIFWTIILNCFNSPGYWSYQQKKNWDNIFSCIFLRNPMSLYFLCAII